MDRLSNVLTRFSLNATVFFTGNLCGVSAFEDAQTDHGHLHLLKSGELTVRGENGFELHLNKPALLFYPRPNRHRLFANESGGVELVCAQVNYRNTLNNPLANALPEFLYFNLDEAEVLGKAAYWLFDEAFSDLSGKQPVVDRLCDIFLINVLRHLLTEGRMDQGMLAGLAHPQLANALTAIHGTPENPWSLATLAQVCGMSRSKFASEFKQVIGQPPADYLTDWRLSIAQQLLLEKQSMDFIANSVGYESGSALARVFKKKMGKTASQWLAEAVPN